LAECNGGTLERAITLGTVRHVDSLSIHEICYFLPRPTHTTIHTDYFVDRAMEFKNLLWTTAGLCMEPVDVLGYESRQFTRLFYFHDCMMGSIWYGITHGRVSFTIVSPVNLSIVFTGTKLLIREVISIVFGPYSSG
jgi:hypothetical protein